MVTKQEAIERVLDVEQRKFLAVVQEQAPQVLGDLKRRLRLYAECAAQCSEPPTWFAIEQCYRAESHLHALGVRARGGRARQRDPFVELAKSLHEWGTKHGLDAEWCYGHGVATLRHWSARGFTGQWAFEQAATDRAISDAVIAPVVTLPGERDPSVLIEPFYFAIEDAWNPRAELWTTYKQRIVATLKQALSEYRPRAQAVFKATGHQPAFTRRTNRSDSERRAARYRLAIRPHAAGDLDTLHHLWLVERQVNGRTYAKIAKETEYRDVNDNVDLYDEPTVRESVRRLAGLLALPLRAEKP